MYCQSCGTALGNSSVAVCANCGQASPASGSGLAKELSEQVKTSSKDAAAVLRRLLSDPVGGLGAAYAGLGPDRALPAGVALCVAFAVAAAAGVVMGASQWLGSFGGVIGAPDGFGAFLKLTLQFLVLPVAIAAVGLGLRSIAGARPPVAADLFTTGAALAPLGFAILLAGIIGVRNFEIVLLLFFFAISYLTMMLYAGFTRIGGLSERAAAPCVPIAMLLAGWLCKAVFGAIAGPAF